MIGNNGLVEQYRYDAFGQPTIMDSGGNVIASNISAINNRFMFTGREWAPKNLGFYEYRARAYHPVLGRFMSEDPKGFDAGDYNLFRYCHNDPVDHVDPTGLDVTFLDPYKKTHELYNEKAKFKSDFAKQYEAGRYQATHNKDGSVNDKAAKAFRDLEATDKVHATIVFTNKKSYNADQLEIMGDPKTRQFNGNVSFEWNPFLARLNKNGTQNTPGAVLAHEVWHAAEMITNPSSVIHSLQGGTRTGQPSKFGGPEERRVLDLESAVFPHLRNEGVRNDLSYDRWIPVSSPADGGRP